MSPKKSSAKSDNKRKAPEAEEAAAPVSASGSAGADGSAVVAFEKTKKQPLDAGDSKRFKAHANYTSTNAKATEEDREFASRALELYKNGTQEQKHKILCTFRVDKTYKWTTSFAEETVDAVANKTQYRGGWLSKYEVGQLHNIPTHDPVKYEELCDAAVDGLPTKPHTNPGLAAKGMLLYDVPEFQVGGSRRESSSTTAKTFRSEADLSAGQLKKLADGDEVKIKLEHPEFVALQGAVKLIDKGHKLMTKSLNNGRALVAKIKLFTRSTPDSSEKFDTFHLGMQALENMELDVLSLIQMCKEVEKDDMTEIAELKNRCESALENGKTAVQDFEALRANTAKLV